MAESKSEEEITKFSSLKSGEVELSPKAVESRELSEEELDDFLKTEDPDFFNRVQSLQADSSLSLAELDLDSMDEALLKEVESWRDSVGVKSLIYRVFPLAPKISLKVKIVRFKLRALFVSGWLYLTSFGRYLLTEGRRQLVLFLTDKIKRQLARIKASAKEFANLSSRLKLFFLGFSVLFIMSIVSIFYTLTGRLVPDDAELFISGVDRISTEMFIYDPEVDVEPFYDNLRSVPNLLLVEKLVANVKRSRSSGANPMAAFEFFLESHSQDVLVEIKSREAELRDLIQREIEQFSFDDLSSPDGKRELCERLVREISRILVSGRLKAVRIKTVVLKP